MPAKITLTVTQGKLHGQEFAFAERNSCVVGRAKDCRPQLPNDPDHKTISRHHCLLDINPPDIRVRDFGSRNGTFVNGQKIGQREKEMTAEEGARMQFPEHDLKDGDEIRLGKTVFRLSVGKGIGSLLPERPPGCFTPKVPDPFPQARVCVKCGRDISKEMGENRHGDFLCAACQADPFQVLKNLLELAQSGRKDVLAIQGYQIIKELGKGGMGAVYLARQEKSGRHVALKVMLPKVAVEEQAREMFLREAENTRALKHPHVVQLYEVGCAQGTFFFTLEFCDGGSVDRLMKERGGTLQVEEAGAIILQALAGLEYAHQAEVPRVKLADGSYGPGRGLVHRDLKPQNLFLCGSGKARIAKIGDFGLAKAFDLAGLSGYTRTGSAMGTPVFMPRQQVVNFRYAKPDVDVWALAASFYYMLTGAFPRDFPRGKDPWLIVLETSAVPIRQRNAAIPKKLAKMIDQALVDNPDICFKRAGAFKRALEDVL